MADHLGQIRALLTSWGIDPHEVVQMDINEEGYLRFQRTPLGQIKTSVTGEAYVDFVEWPEGFPVDEFFKLVHAWQGARA